eukprot:gene9688-1894_t
MDKLSPDIQHEVLRFLDQEELKKVSLVSKKFSKMYLHPELWQKISLSKYGHRLTSNHLKSILFKFPELRSLTLSTCSNLVFEDFQIINTLCPKLEELDISKSFFSTPQESEKYTSFPDFNNLKKLKMDKQYHQQFYHFLKDRKKNETVIFVLNEEYKHILGVTIAREYYYFDEENYNLTVWDFKKLFEKATGNPRNEQRLIYRGKRCEDQRTLKDYNFGTSSYNMLHIVLRLRSSDDQKIMEEKMFVEENAKFHVDVLNAKNLSDMNVFKFPLMHPKYCQEIVQNGNDYSKESIVKMIESIVLPHFKITEKLKYEIFFVRYSTSTDTDFVLHTDHSKYTLNICLEATQLSGCEIGFLTSPDLTKEEKLNILDLKKDDFVYEKIFPVQGEATFHSGDIPHITFPIFSGRRTNMIIWMNPQE